MLRTLALQTAISAAFMLGFALPQAALAGHHEAVIQTVLVDVKPGKLGKYMDKVSELRRIMNEMGSAATIRVWRTTAAGPATGTVLVGVEYPNAAAWAKDQGRLEGNSDWQGVMKGLHKLRSISSQSLWRDISPTKSTSAAGPVLVVTGVQVKPGKLGEYRRRVGRMQGISERLNLSGRVRMWQAELAGPDTGNVAVGVEYPSLEVYVADQAKLAGDSEWNRLLSGLEDIRSFGTRVLYQEITP